MISYIKHSDFVKNILTLASGKIAASVISLLFVPLIARLFEPQHYGIAIYFVSFLTVLVPLSSLCFEYAIVLPKSELKSFSIVRLALMLVILFSFVFLVASIVLLNVVNGVLIDASMDQWIWVVPIAILILGFISVFENYSIRRKKYRAISRSDVYQALFVPVSRVTLGLTSGSSVSALILGYLGGLVIKLVTLRHDFLCVARRILFNKNLEPMAQVSSQFRDFPFFNMPSKFVRIFSNNMPILFFGLMFSPEIVGLYAMAIRLIRMPTEAVANAIRKVFLKKLVELNEKNTGLQKTIVKLIISMTVVGIIPFSIMFIYGQEIIGFILGANWLEAGLYAEILTPWFFTIWLTMPASAIFVVRRKQHVWLWIQLVVIVLRTLAFVYIYVSGLSPLEAIEFFVVLSVVLQSLIIVFMIWIADIHNDVQHYSNVKSNEV